MENTMCCSLLDYFHFLQLFLLLHYILDCIVNFYLYKGIHIFNHNLILVNTYFNYCIIECYNYKMIFIASFSYRHHIFLS